MHFLCQGGLGFILCKLAKIGVRLPALPVGNNFQKAVRNSGLFSSQEPDSGSEGATVKGAEGEKLRRVLVVVHDVWILMVGDVVESAAQRPIKTQCVKSLLQMQVQGEVVWKAMGPGRLDHLLLLVDHGEGKSGAGLERVAGVEAFHERQPSPGDEAIRRVPPIRPGNLRTK